MTALGCSFSSQTRSLALRAPAGLLDGGVALRAAACLCAGHHLELSDC